MDFSTEAPQLRCSLSPRKFRAFAGSGRWMFFSSCWLAVPDPLALLTALLIRSVRRAGFIQARAHWVPGPALYVFQISNYVC